MISKSERAKGNTDKDDWYAIAGVRLLLTLDLRVGTWSLHSHPGEDGYRGSLSGEYGEQIPLPEPFSFALDTADLPRYSERP
ncbi:hypothetical protein [Spirillospora sp. CA-294931]|uniref:hypothetical protein n=1 Tax=Spirillospora sp. CA-294931 TaxID=3240042 RepID=UPI003D91B784